MTPATQKRLKDAFHGTTLLRSRDLTAQGFTRLHLRQAVQAGLLERAGGLRAALGEEHPAVLAAASGTVPPELLARARALLLARLAAD